MVKLAPADREANRGAVGTSAVVLQVTPSSEPSAALEKISITLPAVTLVESTMHVPPDALVEHEKLPADDAPQATTEGDAPLPTPAHLPDTPKPVAVTGTT